MVDAELPVLLIMRFAWRDGRHGGIGRAARLRGSRRVVVPVLVLCPALRDAGQWGYEGHFRGPVRLAASGLGYVAAMRIRGRRGGPVRRGRPGRPGDGELGHSRGWPGMAEGWCDRSVRPGHRGRRRAHRWYGAPQLA